MVNMKRMLIALMFFITIIKIYSLESKYSINDNVLWQGVLKLRAECQKVQIADIYTGKSLFKFSSSVFE